MRFMVIHGPNLNMLKSRPQSIYGQRSLEEINNEIRTWCMKNNIHVDIVQSNCEGEIIDYLHKFQSYNGIVINPGAYTHYSYAIGDAVELVNIPVVEVHLSDIYSREDFRRKSVIASHCYRQISGFGFHGYILALQAIIHKIEEVDSMTYYRVAELKKQLKEKGLDAMLVNQPENRQYITGFTGSSGYVLFTQDKDYFFTDFRYIEQAKEQLEGFEIVKHGFSPLDDISQYLSNAGVQKLGFEEHFATYQAFQRYQKAFKNIQVLPAGPIVEEIRKVKDRTEIENTEKAIDIAVAAFEHILGFLKPGIKEVDVALELEFFMRKKGASGLAFETIVASGHRSALPHGIASEKVLEEGDFVKMDFGCVYNGYCSDISRTVVLGKATDKQKKIYDTVLKAQQAAIDNIKAGVSGKKADDYARSVITEAGYGDKFGHGLGHGIGMVVHENPRVSPNSEDILRPGNIITVEPGIYIPEYGGVRIEDMLVITEDGSKNLTKATKEFIEIT
ncbi:type II 3-dehydroquinate dehydratase [Proteinivorax hydrogeniformans]|uniref:3-dehydroquinate dehydratase n=1 Tax=Proteinivorax hydrogeniformans TaxID=1826727 RepID=A0AAU8HS26_9FIRM